MTDDRLKFIQKVLDSIYGCLSISVNSCDNCVHRDISHPKCKNLLLRDAQNIIRYFNENMEGISND